MVCSHHLCIEMRFVDRTTGTWLADLGQLQKGNPASLSLHGVDLGSSLFRGHQDLDLREHDVRKPFPTSWEWSDKFDLVHQRLLVWGIGSDEWTAVIHTLTDAVKPGGYIQLVEAEWVLSSYTEEQPEQKKLAIVQDWSCSSSGMNVHIWKKMAGILENCGFLDIRETPFDLGYGATAKQAVDRQWTAELLPKSFRHLARKMPSMFDSRELTSSMAKSGLLTSSLAEGGIPGVARDADEYMTFLDRLVLEMKAVGYTPKLRWITARKPPL